MFPARGEPAVAGRARAVYSLRVTKSARSVFRREARWMLIVLLVPLLIALFVVVLIPWFARHVG